MRAASEKLGVARLLYMGVTVLGFPEEKVWRMTVRKILLLFEEHQLLTGAKQSEAEKTLDDIFNF